MDFGIASVAAITVICYLVGLIVKSSGSDTSTSRLSWPVAVFLAWRPRIPASDFPATDPLTAVAVGIKRFGGNGPSKMKE